MDNYRRVPTTLEVWRAIRSAHGNALRCFGSYSAPCGSEFGDPSQGVMQTSFGFDGADWPLIEAKTTWDIDSEHPERRNNERHEYWLCVPIREDD